MPWRDINRTRAAAKEAPAVASAERSVHPELPHDGQCEQMVIVPPYRKGVRRRCARKATTTLPGQFRVCTQHARCPW